MLINMQISMIRKSIFLSINAQMKPDTLLFRVTWDSTQKVFSGLKMLEKAFFCHSQKKEVPIVHFGRICTGRTFTRNCFSGKLHIRYTLCGLYLLSEAFAGAFSTKRDLSKKPWVAALMSREGHCTKQGLCGWPFFLSLSQDQPL